MNGSTIKTGRLATAAAVAALAAGMWLAPGMAQQQAALNAKVMPAHGPLTAQTISRLALTDVARSGNRVVAVGDRGYIVYSDSNGEKWERAKTDQPNLPMLTGISFADANTAWAVGHDATILKSTDQGKEWVRVFSAEQEQRPLMDIAFIDAQTGFAVGAYGAFYETTDGGKTWTARKVIPTVAKPAKPTARGGRGQEAGGRGRGAAADDPGEKGSDEDRHLNAILKLGDGRLLIAGEAGTLLLSTDGGKAFNRLPAPYKGSFFGAVAADDGGVVIFGLRGNVYRSANAALTEWSKVETGTTASFMGATKLADGAIVIAGLSGTVMISRDHGKTLSALKSGTTKALAAPVVGGSNALILVGEAGARDLVLAADAAPKK